MQRVLVLVVSVLAALALLASSCSSDAAETEGTIDGPQPELATAEPAPTVEGIASDIEQSATAIASDVVIFGLDQDERVPLRALPGEDQPIVVELAPSDQVESLEQLFETDDGAQWIQVQALNRQGWIRQMLAAYRGPTQDVTEPSLAALGTTSFAAAEEAATAIGLAVAAQDGSAADVVIVGMNDVAGVDSTTVIADLVASGSVADGEAVLGTRLTIALDPANGWAPVSVFESVLCARGVTAQGECV